MRQPDYRPRQSDFRVKETTARSLLFSGLLQSAADCGCALVGLHCSAAHGVHRALAPFQELLTGRGEATAEPGRQELIRRLKHAPAIEAVDRIPPSLAAPSLMPARSASGRVIDPAARFRFGDGGRLERLNMLRDVSEASLRQSYGPMANCLDELADIESNHEAFVGRNEVVASASVWPRARSRSTWEWLAALTFRYIQGVPRCNVRQPLRSDTLQRGAIA
jgi:hypothetical protein